jgi:hypothetical protein
MLEAYFIVTGTGKFVSGSGIKMMHSSTMGAYNRSLDGRSRNRIPPRSDQI